jgi:RimJ/RimL family protein N-acetyltransferase
MGFSILTKRLVIRLLEIGDAEAMFNNRSDPDISRYQSWEPESVEEMQNFILDLAEIEIGTPGRWYQLGIFIRDSRDIAGDAGIHTQEEDPRQVEIGITLAKAYQGRGLATEALEAVFGYLFNELGKHRVYASVDPRNTASIALLERLGMRREAHFVESLWFKGVWADDVIYALLSREFQQRGSGG